MNRVLIARWESKTGKHFVELYRDMRGYSYHAPGAGGSLGVLPSDEIAIEKIKKIVDVGYFLPDAAKTPMHRTNPPSGDLISDSVT